MTKAIEFRELDAKAMESRLKDLESEYFDLKFQSSLSKLENVSLIMQKRRDIARLKTIIAQKQEENVES